MAHTQANHCRPLREVWAVWQDSGPRLVSVLGSVRKHAMICTVWSGFAGGNSKPSIVDATHDMGIGKTGIQDSVSQTSNQTQRLSEHVSSGLGA